MRRILHWSMVALAAAPLLTAVHGFAGDKDKKDANKGTAIGTEPKVIDGALATNDPIDKMTKRPFRTHKVVLEKDKVYRIDMQSKDVDSFLRLENADGKQLALDDDGGGFPDARIIQKIDVSGEYTIVATCYDDRTGKYKLTIRLAEPREILVAKVRDLSMLPAEERMGVLAEVKKEFAQNPGKIDRGLANTVLNFAINMEFVGKRDRAIEIYTDFGKILATASNPDVAKMGKLMEGALRRAKLLGNSIVVHGQTLAGKEFDWKACKGKVVLVDFWATWWGPCLAEIPNIKKMHEAYNQRGFEVVAISTDERRDAPAKYMEKEKLPWVCLFDPEPGKDREPLAQYYGVFGIPLAVLVDREGRVVSMNARGPELERLLVKHIGPREKSAK